MLTVNKVSKVFEVDEEKIITLREVSFTVETGEFFAIIGPSGSGKSTLLRIIANLLSKTSGKLSWQQPPKIGFVFQNYALLPYLTVFENIEFGLKMKGVKKADREKIVERLISEIGLAGFADKHPKELSGGMKQRVGIARALAIDPNVLLLDEPFSSLDELTSETLRKLLLNLWQERKITIIMITHLIAEAIELSDKIAVMQVRGTIEQVVSNTLPRPRNLRSQQFYQLEDKLKGFVSG